MCIVWPASEQYECTKIKMHKLAVHPYLQYSDVGDIKCFTTLKVNVMDTVYSREVFDASTVTTGPP